MKYLIILLFAVFSNLAAAQKVSDSLKMKFFEMEKDSCLALDFFNAVAADEYLSSTDRAWAGAFEAASATCVRGAFRKLEYFSRGKKNLEEAVAAEPQNPEIRFLRFATQSQAPNFLEYDNTRDDKVLILEALPQLLQQNQTKKFWKEASQFMLNSGKLSKSESELVKDLTD